MFVYSYPGVRHCNSMLCSDDWPLPSELSIVELQYRAAMYADMAATARTQGTEEALLRLAERYRRMAAESEAGR